MKEPDAPGLPGKRDNTAVAGEDRKARGRKDPIMPREPAAPVNTGDDCDETAETGETGWNNGGSEGDDSVGTGRNANTSETGGTNAASYFGIANGEEVRLLERFTVRGHENVRSTHGTTLEFTRDEHLTTRGNCIAGVGATLAPAGFSAATRELIRAGKRFILAMRAGDVVEHVRGEGDASLTLDDEGEMVFRKSDFVSGRTVLVRCDKAARDLDERLRRAMKDPRQVMDVALFILDVDR